MKKIALSIILGFATALAACGGEAALGEECGESGADGECEAGAVCGKESDDSSDLVCLEVCNDQADCAADEDCNGVEGTSTKGCRPKK